MLFDDRKVSLDEWWDNLKTWGGKHYPKPVRGVNTSYSVEYITEYMDRINASDQLTHPFHPAEFPVLESIQDFVVSLQLACVGSKDEPSQFQFPDCSLNTLQSLSASLHYLAPGKSLWIENKQQPPPDMDKRKVYGHSLPPSRSLQAVPQGLAAYMGAGFESLEHCYGQPVLGQYVASIKFAIHYPQTPQTKSAPVKEDKNGVSGSQLLSSDGTPPLRCLLIYHWDSHNQLFSKTNQAVFPKAYDRYGYPMLWLSHICFYATNTDYMMAYYRCLFTVVA